MALPGAGPLVISPEAPKALRTHRPPFDQGPHLETTGMAKTEPEAAMVSRTGVQWPPASPWLARVQPPLISHAPGLPGPPTGQGERCTLLGMGTCPPGIDGGQLDGRQLGSPGPSSRPDPIYIVLAGAGGSGEPGREGVCRG